MRTNFNRTGAKKYLITVWEGRLLCLNYPVLASKGSIAAVPKIHAKSPAGGKRRSHTAKVSHVRAGGLRELAAGRR